MRKEKGFSLLEIMVVLGVFVIITGIVFELLLQAQQRYKAETELLDTFQAARIAVDQFVRDVHSAGNPPLNTVPLTFLALNATNIEFVAEPFAWTAGYPATPCFVLTSCNNPGGPQRFDLIMESDVDPENNNGVEWVRYQLRGGNLLMRGVAPKVAGALPVAAMNAPGVMVPYVENVMNNATPAEMAAIQGFYPNMFPGGVPVPVFRFSCGVPARACNALHNSRDITEVTITLIVQAPNPDPRTGQLRVVTLTGLARRINPS